LRANQASFFKWGQVLLFASLKNLIQTLQYFIARMKATQISPVYRMEKSEGKKGTGLYAQ